MAKRQEKQFFSITGISSLVLLSIGLFNFLGAAQTFDVPSCFPVNLFEYKNVKVVSFFLAGNKELNLSEILKTFAQDKAKITTTGKTSLIGEALSSDITVFINVNKNQKEKTYLVTVNACVSATAIKQEGYRGELPISGRIFVFTGSCSNKEIESAISPYLQKLTEEILSANNLGKPKFFVVL